MTPLTNNNGWSNAYDWWHATKPVEYFDIWLWDNYQGKINSNTGGSPFLEFETEENAIMFALKWI